MGEITPYVMARTQKKERGDRNGERTTFVMARTQRTQTEITQHEQFRTEDVKGTLGVKIHKVSTLVTDGESVVQAVLTGILQRTCCMMMMNT